LSGQFGGCGRHVLELLADQRPKIFLTDSWGADLTEDLPKTSVFDKVLAFDSS
jgi:hypothetical protein